MLHAYVIYVIPYGSQAQAVNTCLSANLVPNHIICILWHFVCCLCRQNNLKPDMVLFISYTSFWSFNLTKQFGDIFLGCFAFLPSSNIGRSRGGSHIWNGYGCKARAPTGWGIQWEHRLKKWGVIGWEHDFWHPVREKSKNMRSYSSKNEGSLGESTIFFIRWVKFGIRWEKNIKIYGVFGWEHMRL